MDYKERTIEYYNNNADQFVDSTINADMSIVYERFEKYLKPGDRILDLGCGSGRDALYFSKKYDVFAVDGSYELCQRAESLLHKEVRCIMFDELDYVNEFDAVWACASLIHVNRTEIGEIIDLIANSLKPKGILYTCFKYGTGERDKDGRYFNDYELTNAEQLIKKSGRFDVIESFVTGDVRDDHNDERWVNVIGRLKNE